MNDVAAQTVELRLLTHRPAEMTEWWAALLGGAPQSLNAWMTAIHGDSLQVVIERSGIALDYHPEASGVTAINLALRDVQAARPALNRLSKLGSQPHRATGQPGVTALCTCPWRSATTPPQPVCGPMRWTPKTLLPISTANHRPPSTNRPNRNSRPCHITLFDRTDQMPEGRIAHRRTVRTPQASVCGAASLGCSVSCGSRPTVPAPAPAARTTRPAGRQRLTAGGSPGRPRRGPVRSRSNRWAGARHRRSCCSRRPTGGSRRMQRDRLPVPPRSR